MAQNNEQRTVEIIVNGVKANASLKEMNAAAAVLYNQFQKMSADDPGRAKLLADYRSMKDRIGAVKTEMGGVAQAGGVMKQAFANAFAIFTGGGIIGVVQQVFGFLSGAREEFQASAKSSADLEATLRSTGQAAGLTADEIRKIGIERAKVTLFDDDETNRASSMLLTFTNIKKGVFEEAIPAIQDLATKMGGDGPADMKGASIQLGKALNDPIGGIKALTRVGVTFNDQQKEQIAAMVKSGNVAGAQKIILAEMNKEFGGQAEAARKAAGGVATFTMGWNEFKETVGGKVTEVLDRLSQWFGRVLDNAQPLVDMVTALVDEFSAYYREIADVMEGLGLFNEKTDTAKVVVEMLQTAITVMLMPLRALLQISRFVVDVFIDWYNKSELLRGIIGGLGAVISTTFRAIKDDALKYLGGVGDLLVGIFTLDKDKILKGFRATMEATADLALGQGERAANAFQKGYEANKNNRITRSVSVETTETGGGGGKAGGDGSGGETGGESAKDAKAREARAKKHLAELEKQHKAEAAERAHQEMMLNLAEAAIIAGGDKRKTELAAIEFDAIRKSLAVTGSAQERAAAIQLIEAEAGQKLLELRAKFAKEDEQAAKEHLDQLLADEDAAEVEREEKFQQAFENALLNQTQLDQAIYDAKYASLQAKLALEESFDGKTSKLYRATYKELTKLEKDKNASDIEGAKKAQKAKADIAKMGLKHASDVLGSTLDLLFQDEQARKQNHGIYVALSAAKILTDGYREVQSIWEYSAENPANGPTAGAAGIAVGAVQTALAVARTTLALANIGGGGGFSFAKGGRTGSGMSAGADTATMMQMQGLRVGGNGKLIDDSGFAVAGIVHENEYVIPQWLRADPQVAAVENWLEARRLRGYADGGATSSTAAPASAAPLPGLAPDGLAAVLGEVAAALHQLNGRLATVEEWQSKLEVVQDYRLTERLRTEYKQVALDSAIRV